ncbi:hypothetical protein IWQ61_008940 [Dispira simplex]|nr:hypothetical protein IWQ61_008940 [Dispira simplex]
MELPRTAIVPTIDVIPRLHLSHCTPFSAQASYIFQLAWVPSNLYPEKSGNPAKTAPKHLAVSASTHEIKLYDPLTLFPTQTLQFHTNGIEHIQAVHGDPNSFLSSSKDGHVVLWDIRTGRPSRTFTSPHHPNVVVDPQARRNPKQKPPLSMMAADLSNSGHCLTAGTESTGGEAYMYFWDTRVADVNASTGALVRTFNESFSDDITQVKFHPYHDHIVLTGSEDCLLCVFDLQQSDEEDALVAVGNTASTVNRTGWFGPRAEYLYALSPLESFSTWVMSEDGMDLVHRWPDVRQGGGANCHVDYALDCHYQPETQRFYLVTGSNSGQIHIFHVGMHDMQLCQVLEGGHKEPIRAAVWNANQSFMVSGGEDNTLCLWTEGTQTSPGENNLNILHRSPVSRSGSHRGRSRYQPYQH